jgi:hypothetical protein
MDMTCAGDKDLARTQPSDESGLPGATGPSRNRATVTWARLDTMRVGRWGEQFVAMALTRAGLDVYLPAVDDRAIDMLVRMDGEPARFAEFQVKTVRLVRPSYVFLRKRLFPINASRYVALVVLIEGQADPEIFLIPSHAWTDPKAPFVSRDYENRKSEPEYGLTVSLSVLNHLRPYRIDAQLPALVTSTRQRQASNSPP